MRRTSSIGLILILLAAAAPARLAAQGFGNGFPFDMPVDDSTTVAFLPAFPAAPLTDDDFISAVGDDFHRRGEQIRFFGANFVADGAFPLPTESDFIAPRFRKMGMNLVRFHHLDNAWSDHGIFPRNGSTRAIDEVQRGRMEYLIDQLAQEGVFINMNLNVSRTFTAADGVANADSIPDFGKGVTLFDPYLIQLQKEYAEQILTHVNPHRGRALVDDPVLAMVEIANENSLYYMWRSGALTTFGSGGRLILRHARMLDDLWTDFLRARYASTDELRAAWSADAQAEGPELLQDGGFEVSVSGRWQLEYHGGAAANVTQWPLDVYEGSRAARVNVTTRGPEDWRVQFKQVGLTIQEDTTYTVRFALRAEKSRSIPVGVSKNVDPWTSYGSFTAAVTTEWKTFEFTFTAVESVTNDVRLSFTAGGETGSLWVDAASMRRAGRAGLDAGESLEDATVRRLPFSEVLKYAAPRMHDMTAFYVDLQNRYYDEMIEFLRDGLGVRVPISSTNWNFGLPDLAVQSRADYMDSHAYWDHPQFPGQPWSATDWVINNTAMVDASDGGAIARLMAGVPPADKPFTISEYNHAFPNQFQSEGVLFLAAYGAFHDVDGLMFFDYSSSTDWTSDEVAGFFSVHRNPAMMALMPSVARAYREGLVAEALTTHEIRYGTDDVLGYPASDGGGWGGTWLFPETLALRHRIVTASFDAAGGNNLDTLPPTPSAPFTSDTGELRWDPNGLFTVVAPGFFAATGHLDAFEGTELEPAADIVSADGFGTITWVALDGNPLWEGRSLLTVSTSAQNLGMTWDGTRTVHNNWGGEPTLLRPLNLTLRVHLPVALKSSPGFMLLSTLDGTGGVQATRRIDPEADGSFLLTVDQSVDRTAWYGIDSYPGLASNEDGPDRFGLSLDVPYPLPARGTVRIAGTASGLGAPRLEVFDLLGRRLLARDLVARPGPWTLELDLSGFAAGTYHVRVVQGGTMRSQSMIVQ